jgi:hypothetical protein
MFAAILISTLPLLFMINCNKNYQLAPLSSSSSSGSSPVTNQLCIQMTISPTPGPPSTGIYWLGANVTNNFQFAGFVSQATTFQCDIFMILNGMPESTCGVTVTGPNGSAPVTYIDTFAIVMEPQIYANYGTNITAFSYQVGATYTLTTTTSIGTATASMVAPGNFIVASNGSQVTWITPGNYNGVFVANPLGNFVFDQQPCVDINSPVNIPSSVYSSLIGNYSIGAGCQNITSAISGGSGFYTVADYYQTTYTN